MVWELRKANRYQLTAPVFVSWRDPDGRFLRLAGITRDISMRGISFLAAGTVDVGTFVKLNVYLPSLHSQERGMKLHGEGMVVRVVSLGFFEKRIAAEVWFETEPEATLLAASSMQ